MANDTQFQRAISNIKNGKASLEDLRNFNSSQLDGIAEAIDMYKPETPVYIEFSM